MKRVPVLILFVFFVGLLPTNVVYAHPRDSLSDVVIDSLYGGLIGALVGAATLAFVDKASEHEDNIKIGTGAGIILGSVYGSTRLVRSLAEVKDGKITVQLPILPLVPNTSAKKDDLLWNLNLFQISF